ncbi:MAG: CHAT domain-containing protein [Anaerolineae bacterium]|nr:CHAT domain-containing protein [Anaerolineae bacterium]
MSEVYRLQLVERPNGMIESRAIGFAHATVALPFGLEELAGLLADGAFVRVGRALYDVLFPEGEVRDSLAEALIATRQERRPLTVQLHLDPDSPVLPRYPWELIHDGKSFLVADGAVTLARYLDYAQALVPASIDSPLRVLVVAPRPVDAPGIQSAGSTALSALETLRQQGLVHLARLSPPTYGALQQLLSREPYHILHFEGLSAFSPAEAGDPQATLLFEDEHGGSSPVGGTTLHSALFLSQVRLAVLTPPPMEEPSSAPAAPLALAAAAPALIRAGVPAVVAMQHPLSGEQNERFAAQLYHSLAGLAPLSTALAHARGQLLPAEEARFAPVLYLQDKDGAGKLFTGSPAKAAARPVACVPCAPGPISGGYRPEPVFVDRSQAVIEAMRALLGTSRHVCLWGFGGVGKTAVAREVVRRGAWRFPGGIIWLSLQGGRSLAAILGEIAEASGGGRLAAWLEDAARQVAALLAERSTASGGELLLVLDNYEDVAGDPDLKAFLADLPEGTRVLATSRIEPSPDLWHGLELRTMQAADIERILRQKARMAHLPVSPADEPLLAEISTLLEGYPLGVDLAISLARTCSWRHIRDELRTQPPPPLQAILRTTVNEALGEEERRLAARLSVFRGAFDAAAITRLAGTAKWLPQVQRLHELALLAFDGASYCFDAPVREFLYGLLAPEEAQECHEQAFRHLSARRDLDSQVEAYQHAIAAGHHAAARKLLRDRLSAALLNAGRYRQLLGLLDTAIDIPEAFDERFLLSRAAVQRILGQLPEALESLERLSEVPDLSTPSRALALHERGRIYYELGDEEQGDHRQALSLYAQALAIYDDLTATDQTATDRRWLDAELATLFQDIAVVYQHGLAGAQDLAFARQLYSASASLWQRLRDPVSRAISEKQRAEILRTGSDADREEAKRIYRQAMQTFRRKGLDRFYGETLLELGKLYQNEHAYKSALRRFQEYGEIQRRLGLEREEAMAWKQQGEIHQEAGFRGRSVKQAVELYTRALDRLLGYADRWSRRTVVATLLRRGEARLELGQPRLAAQDFREALSRAVAMGTRRGEFDPSRLSEVDRQRLVWACCAYGHVNALSGDGEPCEDLLAAAAATLRSLGHQESSELDCRRVLSLPGWSKHHQTRRT